MVCPKCSYQSIDAFDVCPKCGVIISKIRPSDAVNESKATINSKLVPCKTCNSKINTNTYSCPICGEAQIKSNNKLYFKLVLSVAIILICIYVTTYTSSKKIKSKDEVPLLKVYSSVPVAADKITDIKSVLDDIDLNYIDTYWYQHENWSCIPTVKYKIRNTSDKKLEHLSIRAVFLQNGNAVFSQTTGSVDNLDPGLTTQCIRLSASSGYASMAGVKGKTLSLNLYASAGGSEKLLSTMYLTDTQVKERYQELKDANCPIAGAE